MSQWRRAGRYAHALSKIAQENALRAESLLGSRAVAILPCVSSAPRKVARLATSSHQGCKLVMGANAAAKVAVEERQQQRWRTTTLLSRPRSSSFGRRRLQLRRNLTRRLMKPRAMSRRQSKPIWPRLVQASGDWRTRLRTCSLSFELLTTSLSTSRGRSCGLWMRSVGGSSLSTTNSSSRNRTSTTCRCGTPRTSKPLRPLRRPSLTFKRSWPNRRSRLRLHWPKLSASKLSMPSSVRRQVWAQPMVLGHPRVPAPPRIYWCACACAATAPQTGGS